MKFADPISRTSEAVALTRARLDRPHSPDGDPQAQARLCEGLLVYLNRPALTGLLTGLASGAAPGSTLAASLAIHAADRSTAEVLAAANARRRDGETEPWRTILPRGQQIALLARAGWRADQVFDAAELEASAPAGRTLLVEASPVRDR